MAPQSPSNSCSSFQLPSIFKSSLLKDSCESVDVPANVPLDATLLTDLESYSNDLGDSIDQMVGRLNSVISGVKIKTQIIQYDFTY